MSVDRPSSPWMRRSSTSRTTSATCTSPRWRSSRDRAGLRRRGRHGPGKLPLVPRYRQVVRFVPFDLGRPVWVDDPHFNIDYHLRHTALPRPGRRGRAAQAGRPGHVPAARPVQAAVGDLGGRGPRRRPLGDAVQDPPRHGRRRLGHRPAGGGHGPRPSRRRRAGRLDTRARRRSAAQLAAGAVVDLARSPYEQLRAVRAEHPRAPPGLASSREVARGMSRWPASSGRRRRSSLNGPIGPHRRYAWASTTVDDIKAVRKHLGGTFNDVVLAAITSGFRDLLLSRGRVGRPGRPHPRPGVGPAPRPERQGRRRRHLREQGLGHVRRAAGGDRAIPWSGSTPSPPRWRA